MDKLNITTINASNLNSNANTAFVTAFDVMCDLQYAKDKLLPLISNATIVTPVVKKINSASLNDSCHWLDEQVSMKSMQNGAVQCTDSNIKDLCKQWKGINQFKTAVEDVVATLESNDRITPCNWTASKSFGSNVNSTISGIVC